MNSFFDYINRSTLNTEKKLKTLHKVLKKSGIKNKLFIKTEDPYVFVYSTDPGCDFDGIRIYSIANKIAFKIQNRIDTHPYGRPYLLDFEGMFGAYMSHEDADEMKAGKQALKYFINNIKKFFKYSADSQNDNVEKNDISIRNQGTDYSNQVFSKY